MSLDVRGNTAGKFFVNVGGAAVSFCKKFDGMNFEGQHVENDMGPENFQSKHLGNWKYTPGKFTVGAGMGKGFYDWIKAAFEKAYVRKNGSVVVGDHNHNARTELSWQDGLITSVTIPKCDAAGKDAMYLDVEVDAEQVKIAKASGKIQGTYAAKAQKAWLQSNFRLEIDGLNCSRVSTVDAMTWKCSVATDHTGIHRDLHAKVPAKVTVPNLKITVSGADFDEWSKAAISWFHQGNHLEKDHRQGRLVLLGPDMKTTMAALEFHNLGFLKFNRGALEANSEKMDRMDIEFYMEGLKFSEYVADA
jgi:hypothetical protein